ncbi:MAG TPA: hypothetical protein VF730_17950, partial [Terracidiphilus sp.]
RLLLEFQRVPAAFPVPHLHIPFAITAARYGIRFAGASSTVIRGDLYYRPAIDPVDVFGTGYFLGQSWQYIPARENSNDKSPFHGLIPPPRGTPVAMPVLGCFDCKIGAE